MSNVGYYILDLTMVIVTLWIVKRFLNIFLEIKKLSILSLLVWLIFGVFQFWVEFHSGTASIWTIIINIVLVLGISILGYKQKGKVKLFIVVSLYAVWAIVEMFVFFCVNSMPINHQKSDIIGDVISKIIMIIGIYLFSVLKEKKTNEFVPAKYYFVLLFIPIGSIFIAVNVFYSNANYDNTISGMITFSILLILNLIISEIDPKLAENFMLEKEKIVYAQQIYIMSRNTEEQKKIMENFYEEKHNLINELVALKNSVENSDRTDVIENINRIIDVCDINEKYSNCGNGLVDALINFKYTIAKEQHIKFILKIFIPEILPINQCDMGIILGNTIDNAIEAVKKCKSKEKNIYITMGIKKEALVLIVKNPYEHCVKKDKNGNLLSTKKEFSRHGYGINSIKRVADRYNGEVLIDMQDGIFTITIIMNLGEF